MLYGTSGNNIAVLRHTSQPLSEENGLSQNGRIFRAILPKLEAIKTRRPVSIGIPRMNPTAPIRAFAPPVRPMAARGPAGRGRFADPYVRILSVTAPGDIDSMPNRDLGVITGPSGMNQDMGMSGLEGFSLKKTFKKVVGKKASNLVSKVAKVTFALPRLATASTIRAVGIRSTTAEKALGLTNSEKRFVENYGRYAVYVGAAVVAPAVIAAGASSPAASAAMAAKVGYGAAASTAQAAAGAQSAAMAAQVGYGAAASTAAAATKTASTVGLLAKTAGVIKAAAPYVLAAPLIFPKSGAPGAPGDSGSAPSEGSPTIINVGTPDGGYLPPTNGEFGGNFGTPAPSGGGSVVGGEYSGATPVDPGMNTKLVLAGVGAFALFMYTKGRK